MHIGSLFQQLPHEPVPKYSNHPIHYKLTLALQRRRHFHLWKTRDSKQIKGVSLRSKIFTLADLQHRKNLTAKLTGSFCLLWFLLTEGKNKNKKYILVLQLIRKKRKKLCINLILLQVIKISNLHFGMPRERHTLNKSLLNRGHNSSNQLYIYI